MYRSEKIDSTASERLVFFAFPQKQSMTHKNGNFICRWREIMFDVMHFLNVNKKMILFTFLLIFSFSIPLYPISIQLIT